MERVRAKPAIPLKTQCQLGQDYLLRSVLMFSSYPAVHSAAIVYEGWCDIFFWDNVKELLMMEKKKCPAKKPGLLLLDQLRLRPGRVDSRTSALQGRNRV